MCQDSMLRPKFAERVKVVAFVAVTDLPWT
jgi:hypothetical protein